MEEIQQLVTASGALERVGQAARDLAESAVHQLEEIDVNGIRPVLTDLAQSAVNRAK